MQYVIQIESGLKILEIAQQNAYFSSSVGGIVSMNAMSPTQASGEVEGDSKLQTADLRSKHLLNSK